MKIKKLIAAVLISSTLAACVPAISGCGKDGPRFTLSEDGTHYIISCSGLSTDTGEYAIPAYYGDENLPVTEIAQEGFASTSFSKIIVPKTVTKIGNMAFSYCNFLQTVEFEEGIQLESFSQGMFGHSEYLQEIEIPDSVKTLGDYVFTGCNSLSSVTLGSGVETIGAQAFANCIALEEITLPSTLVTIGTLAFYNTSLKSVEIPDSVHDIVINDDEEKSTVYGLGLAAFNDCIYLESVKVGSGVTIIPSGAFGYCISLKEIYLPATVTEVQGAYFRGNAFVFGHAFNYCSALTDVYYEGDEEQWKSIKISNDPLYESGVTMDNSAIIKANKHYGN